MRCPTHKVQSRCSTRSTTLHAGGGGKTGVVKQAVSYKGLKSHVPGPPGLDNFPPLVKHAAPVNKAWARRKFVGTVARRPEVCALTTEVTVDSAADESVCPAEWGEQFGLTPVTDEDQQPFVNASGGKINHYGSRRVVVRAASGENLAMNFQVTDVRKPLLSVSRLCEQGNLVQFGPRDSDNYIQNVAGGQKLRLERRGNSWVIPGQLAEAGF